MKAIRLSRLRGRASGLHRGVDPSSEIFSLAKHAGVALVVVAACVVIGPALGVRLNPVPCTVIALTIGVLIWLLRRGDDPAWTPIWVQHQAEVVTPRSQSDLATRRLADMMASAQPGRDFTSHQLSHTLAQVAEHRLVQRHGADPDDTLPTAERLLSPALVSHLYSDQNEAVRPINRATLHRYLKEISEL